MRFQIGSGWLINQFFVPPSTILDYGNKQQDELTPWEQLAQGRTPPIDACAFDADAAVAMWRSVHPDLQHRLRRKLDPYNEETFQRLLAMDEITLERHWPRKGVR
jgi:hypothetical protein